MVEQPTKFVMNITTKQKILSIIIALGVLGVTVLWIYLTAFWNSTKPVNEIELLPQPIEQLNSTNKTDSVVIGTNSQFRIDVSFENEKLNPYPYSVSSGTVKIIDNSTNAIVPVNGTLSFVANNIGIPKKLTNEYRGIEQDVAFIQGTVTLEHGYVKSLEPVPFRYGPFIRQTPSLGLIIENGIGTFDFINIHRTRDYVNFDFQAQEYLLDEFGIYTIVVSENSFKPNLQGYDNDKVGQLIRTNKSIPYGEYEDFEPPEHIASNVITNFDYYYDIVSNPKEIIRSEHKEITLTITPKTFGSYNLPEIIDNRIEMNVLPAYEVSSGITYPARIYSVTSSTGEVLYDWKIHPTSSNKSEDVPGDTRARFKVDEKPITIKLQMTDEPTHIPFVGFNFEVICLEGCTPNKNTLQERGSETMEITEFIPIQVETNLPNRFVALWYLLVQATKILLGGILLSWLQYKHRKKTHSRIDKKPKI